MQELGKFNFKINVLPNKLEKYMSFIIDNKFQFLNSSLDSLVKNLGKDDFKYLCKVFDSNILDLVKKDFILVNLWVVLKNSKKDCQPKKSSLTCKKINDKEYEHVFSVWDTFEMKTMKDYHDLCLKSDLLLIADVFEKFRNSSLKSDAHV